MLKPLLLTTILTLYATTAIAETIADGDFMNWAFDSTGTAAVSWEDNGGNPGNRLNITTVSGSLVYGTAILSGFGSLLALQGETFDLAIDVIAGPGSYGAGQAIQLLVEQNGSIYGNYKATTGYHTDWYTFSAAGTFYDTEFSLLIGAGPANPDFSGGTFTRFGFAAGNADSGTLTQYYDNFSLASPAIVAVPEPETYALMLVGLGLVGIAARRRRA